MSMENPRQPAQRSVTVALPSTPLTLIEIFLPQSVLSLGLPLAGVNWSKNPSATATMASESVLVMPQAPKPVANHVPSPRNGPPGTPELPELAGVVGVGCCCGGEVDVGACSEVVVCGCTVATKAEGLILEGGEGIWGGGAGILDEGEGALEEGELHFGEFSRLLETVAFVEATRAATAR